MVNFVARNFCEIATMHNGIFEGLNAHLVPSLLVGVRKMLRPIVVQLMYIVHAGRS